MMVSSAASDVVLGQLNFFGALFPVDPCTGTGISMQHIYIIQHLE